MRRNLKIVCHRLVLVSCIDSIDVSEKIFCSFLLLPTLHQVIFFFQKDLVMRPTEQKKEITNTTNLGIKQKNPIYEALIMHKHY